MRPSIEASGRPVAPRQFVGPAMSGRAHVPSHDARLRHAPVPAARWTRRKATAGEGTDPGHRIGQREVARLPESPEPLPEESLVDVGRVAGRFSRALR
jgi:hypothetical protein